MVVYLDNIGKSGSWWNCSWCWMFYVLCFMFVNWLSLVLLLCLDDILDVFIFVGCLSIGVVVKLWVIIWLVVWFDW